MALKYGKEVFQIPELETGSGDLTVLGKERWLDNACRVM